MSTIKIKQVKSKIRRPKNQKSTLEALGLKKIGHVVEHEKTPSIEGMIKNIKLELNGDTDIILTGGFSQLISPKLNVKHRHIPNLTLDGINLIHEENKNE